MISTRTFRIRGLELLVFLKILRKFFLLKKFSSCVIEIEFKFLFAKNISCVDLCGMRKGRRCAPHLKSLDLKSSGMTLTFSPEVHINKNDVWWHYTVGGVAWRGFTLQAKNQFWMTSARLKNSFANQLYMLLGLTLQSFKLKDPLTHFSPVSHFYTPWKRQKTFG